MIDNLGSLTLSGGPSQTMATEETDSLLRRWREPDARTRLFEMVYPDLRRLAAARLRAEKQGHTLQTSDLVNEVFLRLVKQGTIDWEGRTHFLAVAALGMKRILIDHARRRQAKRRHGGTKVPLNTSFGQWDPFDRLIELDLLLDRLAASHARVAETFELHYFGGLTFDQIGSILDIDPRTAKRDWQLATAWLTDILQPADRP